MSGSEWTSHVPIDCVSVQSCQCGADEACKYVREIERLREAEVIARTTQANLHEEIDRLRGLLRDVMTDFDGYLGESLTRRVRKALGE